MSPHSCSPGVHKAPASLHKELNDRPNRRQNMPNKWWSRTRLSAVATIASGAAAGAMLFEAPRISAARSLTHADTSVTIPHSASALENLSDDFATVAARVKPSVVYITAKETARTAQMDRGQTMPQIPPEFRQFFDLPGMPRGADPRGAPRDLEASGSGFIVS